MLKASALYMVIIISLVVGLLCSSLIVVAYYYRLQYQRTFRYDQLQNNLSSGIAMLTASQDSTFVQERTFSLYQDVTDSVTLKKVHWGIFDIGAAIAFSQKDTLYKAFSIANTIDSSKWGCLYLIDEQRPVSVSGKTTIRGDAYITKAGIKEVYVDGSAYLGDKKIISGVTKSSASTLPTLRTSRLALIKFYFDQLPKTNTIKLPSDSLQISFFSPTRVFAFGEVPQTLQNIKLSGNIILTSDTTVTLDKSATMNHVLVYAKDIVVKAGFNGICQLFASNSITVENDCNFAYPSCLGTVRFKATAYAGAEHLSLGENTHFSGLLFTYDQDYTNSKQPIIDLDKNVAVSGQVYAQGILAIKDGIVVKGSVYASRFMYKKNNISLYENFLINLRLDEIALSPYYLTSDLLPTAGKTKKVLQWLE